MTAESLVTPVMNGFQMFDVGTEALAVAVSLLRRLACSANGGQLWEGLATLLELPSEVANILGFPPGTFHGVLCYRLETVSHIRQ
jgi:hypothetical protein